MTDEKGPCPRCGHDTSQDPSRTPEGDHLVIEQGPVSVEGLPDTDDLTFRFVATQDVRTVWCSQRVLPPGGERR
jgi:hypothetical protein